MNQLEKGAWSKLGGMILCVVIAGPGIWWMVSNNIKGPVVMTLFLMSGLIAGAVTHYKSIKNWTKLDEREKMISHRAYTLSSRVCILFLYCASFAVFLIAGASNLVPAYILPALFLSGLFLMVLVYSAAILVQYRKNKGEKS
jgi:hypothetical protein